MNSLKIRSDIITGKKNFIKYDDMSRNYSMPVPHYHNYYEIYFLVNGKCRFSIEDRFYNINKNNMLIIPPGLVHKAEDYPEMTNRIILNFSVDCINDTFKKKLSSFRTDNFYIPPDASYVLNTLKNIEREFHGIDEISNHMALCHLSLLLEYLIRNETLDTFSKKQPHKNVSLQPMEQFIRYILDNFDKDITLNDLSREFGYSPNHISYLFKENIGVGFRKYLSLQRLKNAEYLLSTTDKSIQSIAMECGFNDSNYFSTVFKKNYSVTPLEHRSSRR